LDFFFRHTCSGFETPVSWTDIIHFRGIFRTFEWEGIGIRAGMFLVNALFFFLVDKNGLALVIDLTGTGIGFEIGDFLFFGRIDFE
jgi:hypothetical protein